MGRKESFVFTVCEREKKKILRNNITIILTFKEDIIVAGVMTIEASTESNRRPKDLAGLGQAPKLRT